MDLRNDSHVLETGCGNFKPSKQIRVVRLVYVETRSR